MARVAVAQLRASTDKDRNLRRIVKYVSEAAAGGAGLVAFPEFMMFYTPPGQTPAELARLAENIDGPFVKSVADAARDYSIEVVGTIYERSPRRGRVYDTSFLLGRDGSLLSSYRKIHLYDALGFKESAKLAPGDRMTVPSGSSVGSLGMLICYDLRFPEAARTLASSGAGVIVAPSAWVQGKNKEDQWITMNRARAMENGCYLVSPAHVGNIYCGRSLVVDPWGGIILDMGKRQGLGYATVSPEIIGEARRAMPLLKSRRTDVYPDFSL
ncbi:amidohydrolase [Cenarchaeum symbiosum A]|uniref:Amidohydrolase n=1 Tax=Cenarchaeum symbiosum (strain A) TaxID=414004 RepID=A0RYH6_CENSY|nr:amidohydrolase [Cenarchaeum symbiosum A]